MEHLSQFDMTMLYIHGEDNTVTDAPSHTPLPNDSPSALGSDDELETCSIHGSFNTILLISGDKKFLHDIHKGYKVDEFCKKTQLHS
jgi:hypothetical protein